ncbi:hypothetical protein FJ656_30705, partial [Schumannella luteola]
MPTTRRTAALSTVLALTAASVLALGAAPASAATSDVVTPGLQWTAVDDNALTIGDVAPRYRDVAGTGIDIDGYGSLSGLFTSLTASYGPMTGVPVTITPVSAVYLDDGLTSITA